jgi:hypothetical protein
MHQTALRKFFFPMSNYNFEGHSEGDWDEQGELSWGENDWQHFLSRHEKEVQRFIEIYRQCRHLPNHLDEIALLMGWDALDWAVLDPDEFDSEADEENDLFKEVRAEGEGTSENSGPPSDSDPYTMQRHPVYVVVRGLYRLFDFYFEKYLKWGQAPQPTPCRIWEIARVVRESEHQASLAVSSLDMGDLPLAVCQMKISHAAINECFRLLGFLETEEARAANLFFANVQQVLFDLREVCLRVMTECRIETRRQLGLGDDQEF